jgi:hypothetical protein
VLDGDDWLGQGFPPGSTGGLFLILADAAGAAPDTTSTQLAFGTEVNSTKAFALLSGVIDWLKPKAAVLTEKWQTADEAQ